MAFRNTFTDGDVIQNGRRNPPKSHGTSITKIHVHIFVMPVCMLDMNCQE